MWIHILCVIFIPLVSCLPSGLSKIIGRISKDLAGDRYVFVGGDLRLTCSPLEEQLEKYGISNVSFSFLNLQSASRDECLPVSLVHVSQDQQKATLVVHNVTLDDAGQYTCHIGKHPCLRREDIPQLETAGFIDIIVEYPPHNVSQFVCVFYNWNDSVNCTWQHPVNYNNWSNIHISAAYTVSSRHDRVSAFRCPHLSTHGCTFKNTDAYLVENYVVEVNVTNALKDITASQIFHVNAFKSVKPAPVINLSAQAMPGCITLSWGHSRNYEKVYRIRHQIVGADNIEVVNDNITNTHFTHCGYRSYTHHNFSVDSYPAVIYSGYWSDPVYIQAWTPMTAANVGPTTINGSYTSTKCVHGYRNVTLMWQEMEESDRNGIIDGYLIKLGEKHLKNVSSDVHLTVVELLCGSPSVLTIFAHNKGGYSVKPSVMVICPDTFAVPKSITESFVVEISANSSSKYKASLRAIWDMTEDADHLNYTIFWCLGLPGDKCEGPINWSEVPGSSRHYDLPILDEEAQKYLYGISVRDINTGTASGIIWTGCLFRHHSPSARVRVDNMYVENGTEYIRVAWNPVQCSYQNLVKVSGYQVKWCEKSQCNDTNGVYYANISASESSYMVSPLTAEVNYMITVQPVVDGQAGEEFPWKVARPHAAAGQNLWWLWAIAVIVVVILCGFMYWKCVSRRKEFQKLASKQVVGLPLDNNQNDSPHMNPATSADCLMTEAPDQIPAVHYRANNETTLIIPHEGIPGEATPANTSEDSFAEDPSNNSRTLLIKPTPQVCDLTFNSSCAQAGGAPSSKYSSQESDDADVRQTMLAKEASSENGWSSPSLTTDPDSYVQFTEVEDKQTGQKEIRVQDSPGTQIRGQMNTHTDHIMFCLEESNQAATLSPAEDYCNVNVEDLHFCDNILEIQTPDDTVTSVESTAPSVIGAQGLGVDFGNGSSEREDLGNSGSDRGDLGNSGSDRGDLGNSGSDRGDLGNSGSDRVDLGNSGSDRGDLGNSGSDRVDLGNSGTDRGDLGNSGTDRGDLGNSGSDRGDLGNSGSDRGNLGNSGSAKTSSKSSDVSFEVQGGCSSGQLSSPSNSGKLPSSNGYIGHHEV